MTFETRCVYPLNITVVGGGIAGLASAYALRKAGHRVLVLERTSSERKWGAGIRSPPNMTRILNSWGLGPRLKEIGLSATGMSFRLGDTGEQIGLLRFHENIMKSFGADFMFFQHGDVHELLLSIAKNAGCEVRYNANVTQVDPFEGSVRLDTGEIVLSDIIVGADGYQSVVRPCVVGQENEGKVDRRCALNMTVPGDRMRNDPELAPLLDVPETMVWSGDGECIYGFPISAGKEYAMISARPCGETRFGGRWDEALSVDELGPQLECFEPRVRKLVALGSKFVASGCLHGEPFANLVRDGGKVVLVGDAAHPLVPSGLHNSAMAIEDAVILGNLCSRIGMPAQIPSILATYEEIRQPRCAAALEHERAARDFLALPRGPEQRKRDAGFREALEQAKLDWDHADEEYLRVEWDKYITMFDYDANEVVDDWWAKWGYAMDRWQEREAVRKGRCKGMGRLSGDAHENSSMAPRLKISICSGLVVSVSS